MYFMWVPYDPDGRDGAPKLIDPLADEPTLRAAVHGLTNDQLVSAWCSSDRRLAGDTDVSRRCAVVALREMMLEEVERRSPMRYRRWLRQGGPSRRSRRRNG
jgi:hypothetical protein